MSAAEIILIVIGIAIFLLGYLMPARKKDIDEEVQLISEDEVRKMISGEVEHVKDRIADIVDETINYSMEKTERAMERLTNEKIMAINEYSDTVLEEIHKNHKEVIFLYDMLNDKHDSLMATVNEATAASDEIKQTLKDAEATVHEAMGKADDVLKAVNEASARINDVLRAADDAVKGVWDAQNAARVAREAAQEAIRIASDLTGNRKAGSGKTADVRQTGGEQIGRETTARQPRAQKPTTSGDVGKKAEESALNGQSSPQRSVAAGADGMTGQEFKPIMPKRVEIVHDPDLEIAERQEMPVDEAAAPKTGLERMAERRIAAGGADYAGTAGQAAAGERIQDTASVDIQFAKDNGRNSNERILELHKAGKSNMAIAKELGLGLGEVKLVIDLFEGM